ncbi:hypothetical protein Tco_0363087 [Tanacetum coccineum]
MTDALLANVQTTQVIEDTHMIIIVVTPEVQQQSFSVSSGFISNMLNPNPNTGIDSILNLNIESTSLVDVPVTMNVEMPPSSVATLPPPPIPFSQPLQQTPVPTPTNVPSTSLQNLPTFGSLFKFKDKVKSLEDDFLEFKQTNLFAEAVSSIPGIVDTYLANKMNEARKAADREEAQADNEDFINKIDENMKKIIKEQVKVQVKEQVSKILPKIEKSVNEQLEAEVLIRSSNEAKTSHTIAANLSELELKKILIDKMEKNKSIDRPIKLGVKEKKSWKEPESTSAPKEKTPKSTDKSKEGSKSHHTSTGKSAQAEEPIHADKDLEEPAHHEFDTRFTEDQSVDETTQHPDWFQKPTKPPTPDRDWNKTFPAKHGPVQPWISTLAQNEDPCELINELMDTPLDFSAFVMNRLKVDTPTPELLAGPTYELMKGSCKSLVELEYFLEEVCKVTTDQLDWNNPEGQQYPHDLRKPLPLIPNLRVTKTKATDYGHIKWIEDFVPNSMWSQVSIVYDKHALWGISHWGILGVTNLNIFEWHNYKHLDWITVSRNDDKLYTFKECDYNKLRLQDIEDMLLLLVQGKLTNLNVEERLAFGVSLRMFTRSVVLKRHVEDLKLAYSNPKGFIYQNKDKKNRLMRIDELHKFSDGTLNNVRSALDDILKHGYAVSSLMDTTESARDVYSRHRILVVTKLKIVEWHNYKHLDWITIRRDDDKLYTFKEGDYNRLRLQDIEDMLLLFVQGKLTNLNVEEHLVLGVSLRMFTRSVFLRRRVEDLQLGVKSYQKKLNLTRSDTYRSDLKRKTPYTAYFNPKGFIYQNKDKKNRLMHIDELYKFSDGTLNDVRSALDDILKKIEMEYLPQTVWRNVDRERAGAMIQAIDRQLRNIRLMRSLEKFIGRRLYGGDLRLLERTI